MYKSALIFRLLVNLLVRLEIMSLLNNNSFTYVLAQESDNYGDSYSKYPTQDKKYE